MRDIFRILLGGKKWIIPLAQNEWVSRRDLLPTFSVTLFEGACERDQVLVDVYNPAKGARFRQVDDAKWRDRLDFVDTLRDNLWAVLVYYPRMDPESSAVHRAGEIAERILGASLNRLAGYLVVCIEPGFDEEAVGGAAKAAGVDIRRYACGSVLIECNMEHETFGLFERTRKECQSLESWWYFVSEEAIHPDCDFLYDCEQNGWEVLAGNFGAKPMFTVLFNADFVDTFWFFYCADFPVLNCLCEAEIFT